MTNTDELYKNFYIPLSEFRQEYKRARFMMKSDPLWNFASVKMALWYYVEQRKKQFLENKLLKDG